VSLKHAKNASHFILINDALQCISTTPASSNNDASLTLAFFAINAIALHPRAGSHAKHVHINDID